MMIARAIALRPMLRARQAECEALGKVPDDVNAELVRAGFYRIVQPKIFGGYEFDAPTFYKVMMEISRGCSETAMGTCAHRRTSADRARSFRRKASATSMATMANFAARPGFNPPGTAVPVEGGYRVSGQWVSASGIDHGTHFVTMAHVKADPPQPGAAAADAPAR